MVRERWTQSTWPSLAFWIFFIASFCFMASRSIELTQDSYSYVRHHVTRTSGYPLFLDLCRLLFRSHSLKGAQILQLMLGLFSAHRLAMVWRRELGLGAGIERLVLVLLAIPVWRVQSTIGTECLSYAFFLLFLACLTGSFFRLQQGAILGMGAFATILLLIRPQFVFLIPFLAVYLIWLFWHRDDRSKNWIATGALVGMVLFSFYAQATYNYVFNGKFSRIPFTGLQVLSVVMYVSDPSDLRLFEEPRDVEYLRAVYQKIKQDRLSYRDREITQMYLDHYNRAYKYICWIAIVPQFKRMIGKAELDASDWEALDRFTVRLSVKLLLRENVTRWIVLTIKQIEETSGHIFLIMVMLCVLAPIRYWKMRAPIDLLFFSVGALGLANYALIGLCEPIAWRYVFYTESIPLPLLVGYFSTARRFDPFTVG